MTSAELKRKVETQSTSNWLKSAVEQMENRDVLDASRDATFLALYCETRLREALNTRR